MPGSYSPYDILEETTLTRIALRGKESGDEISAALADVQDALHEYIERTRTFAEKYGLNKTFRECANQRLLFFMGIT